MKKFLIVVVFVAASCLAFSEVDPRISSYNECFEQKDYEKALSIAENIIASFPDVVEFRREKAKMLSATGQKEKFMEEMLLIRNSPTPSSIKCFFDALSHDLVSKEFRDDLRRLFFQRKDTEILLSWPQFSTDKELVVSKVYDNEEYKNYDYSQVIPAQTGYLSQPDVSLALINTHNEQQIRKQQHLTCFSNIRIIYGATEIYRMDAEIPMQRLDLTLLYQTKCLRSIPLCPVGGFYQSELDPEGELIISCSVHGGYNNL